MSIPLLVILFFVALLWGLWLWGVSSLGVSLGGEGFVVPVPFVSGAMSLPFFVSLFSAINIALSYVVYKKLPMASLIIMVTTIMINALSIILAVYYIFLGQ